MATTKNLCAQIPIALHERVSEERERLGETTSEYIANLIQEYYNMMENQKGGIHMTEKGRTMAFQVPEELFQRIKRHLERETLRTGKKLTQRDFVLNLITQALDEADAESAAEQDFPAEAPAEARVDDEATPADTDTPDEESAVYDLTRQLQDVPEDQREQAAAELLEYEKAKKDLKQQNAEIDRRGKVANLFCKAYEKASLLTATEENVRCWTEGTRMTLEELQDTVKESREIAQVFMSIADIIEQTILPSDWRNTDPTDDTPGEVVA